MSRQMTVAIAGLGSRGRDTYAKAAKMYPDKMKIVAIADIDPEKVKLTAEEYDVPMSHCYESAEDMLEEEKLADAIRKFFHTFFYFCKRDADRSRYRASGICICRTDVQHCDCILI